MIVSSRAQTQDYESVAAAGGLYVAAGNGLAYSTNGSSWTAASLASTHRWHGVTGGQFPVVAVGDQGAVASSSNGRSWSLQSAGTTMDLRAAARGTRQWVAVGGAAGGAGIILVSTNGTGWTLCRNDISNRLDVVICAGGLYLAAGQQGTAMVSTNGWDWTYVDTGSSQNWTAAIFGQSLFRLFGETNAVQSADGASWSASSAPTNEIIQSAAYCGSLFCLVSSNGAWMSANGAGWSVVPGVQPSDARCAVTFSKNHFVIVGRTNPPIEYQTAMAFAGGSTGSTANLNTGNSMISDSGRPKAKIQLPDWRVNLSNLELILEGVLFSSPTPFEPLEVRLGYNSWTYRTLPPGLFGRGWMAGFEELIWRVGTNATVVTCTGQRKVFAASGYVPPDPVPPGEYETTGMPYVAPSGCNEDLIAMNVQMAAFYRILKSSQINYMYHPIVDWDAANRLRSIGRLMSKSDSFGNTLFMEREAINETLMRVVQRRGTNYDFRALTLTNYTTCSWNGTNYPLCTLVIAPDGRQMHFQYDSAARMTSMTDMQGYQATFSYGADGLTSMTVAGKTTTFGYGSGGDIASASNDGGTKHYSRSGDGVQYASGAGRNTMIPQSAGMAGGAVDPMGNTWSIDYDYSVRKPSVITDPQGNSTSFTYDSHGNRTSITDRNGGTTRLQPDKFGHVTAMTTPDNKTWSMDYDLSYRLIAKHAPDGTSAGWTYDDYNQIVSLKNYDGVVTAIERDPYGNVVKVTDPEGGVTTYQYDAAGLRCTGITDARGNTKTMAYDANDRITSIVCGDQTRRMEYDAFGQTKFTDAAGFIYQAERDSRGAITKLTNPAGDASQSAYDADGMLIDSTDPLGRIARHLEYDAAGRLAKETDAKGNVSQSVRDSTGRPVSWTNKRNHSTTFAYDANGNVTSTTPPSGSGTEVDYDTTGRPIRWSRSGQVVEVDYDSMGRIIRKRHNGTQVAAFTYNEQGKLMSAADEQGTTSFTYDKLNRVTAIKYPFYPGTLQATFAYDAAGNRIKVTYPNGAAANATYDNYNRLSIPGVFRNGKGTELPGFGEPPNRVTALAFLGNAIQLGYDARMQVTSIQRPNGINSSLTYDSNGRCTHFDHHSGTVNIAASYTYDLAGNCLTENLTHAIAAPLPAAITQSGYDGSDRVTSINGSTYTHDDNGNLISTPGYSAAFDAENRLISLTRNGVTTQYHYNGPGWLTEKVAGGVTTHYCRDASGLLLAEVQSGSTVNNYFYANGRLLAYGSDSAHLRHVHGDPRGNVLAVSDASGAVAASYAYSPYGNYSASGATNGNAATFGGTLGVRDEGGGIFCMGHRFYDSKLGRFISSDPIGLAGGNNLYAYAKGNPLRFADPTGLSYCSPSSYSNYGSSPAGSSAIAGDTVDAYAKVPEGIESPWDTYGRAAMDTAKEISDHPVADALPDPVGIPVSLLKAGDKYDEGNYLEAAWQLVPFNNSLSAAYNWLDNQEPDNSILNHTYQNSAEDY